MPTEKYPSKFSPGKLITADKLLAEVICERQARAKGIELPLLFWKTDGYKDYWEKELLRQIRSAKALLQLYSPQAISKALKSKKGKTITSLLAPWLLDLVKEEEKKIELSKINQQEYNKEVEEKEEDQLPINLKRPELKNNKSLRDKLDE